MNEDFFTFADLTAQLDSIQEKVQATLRRVRLGIATVQVPDANERLSFPDLAFEFSMATREEFPDAEQIDDFRSWILKNGFRDLIEQIQVHLDWAGSFSKTLQLRKRLGLSGLQEEPGTVSSEIDAYWEKLHWLGLKPKMDHLRKEFGIETNLDDAVTSAQKVRNCLTHRGGLVSEEFDCDESSVLRMVWIEPQIERYSGKEQANLLKKPCDIGRGGLYLVGHTTGQSAFAHGQRVDFTAREFNDIAITCYFYCREVTLAAIRFGREKLGLRDSVPDLNDDWLKQTAVHLYLNTPDQIKRSQAVVISWKDNRLRLVGMRSMLTESQK